MRSEWTLTDIVLVTTSCFHRILQVARDNVDVYGRFGYFAIYCRFDYFNDLLIQGEVRKLKRFTVFVYHGSIRGKVVRVTFCVTGNGNGRPTSDDLTVTSASLRFLPSPSDWSSQMKRIILN